MLNLNCVICAELFGHSDDVRVTPCGHLFHFVCLCQWLERSKSCPQCRNKCTNRSILRVYFNLANLDISKVDIGSLQEQLDNATLQINIKEKELTKANSQISDLTGLQKKTKKTIVALERELEKNKFALFAYAEQIKQLKLDVKIMDDLRKEVSTLKQQIEVMDSVSYILTSTAAETETMLKTENDPKKLATLVTVLKRELRVCETKRTDLRNTLQTLQNEFRREIELKKLHEERVSQLESENYKLTEKLKAAEATVESDKTNASEDSVPSTSKALLLNNGSKSQSEKSESCTSLSPVVKANIDKKEDSNSPYFNIKSSSVGLMSFLDVNKYHPRAFKSDALTMSNVFTTTSGFGENAGAIRKTKSDLDQKFSIFKKPRLDFKSVTKSGYSNAPANTVWNGFGGSDKPDCFTKYPDDDVVIINEPKAPKKGTTAKSANTLSNRLKMGGLRNFKVN